MFDLIIAGGMVVSSDSTAVLDIGVVGEEIRAVAKPGTFDNQAKEVIDAAGLYVMPGAVDPHTHFYARSEGVPVPGIDVQTIAAAHGGTTTFIDFARPTPQESLLGAIRRRHAEIDGHIAVDYSLHAILAEPTATMISEIGNVFKMGIPSLKLDLHGRHARPPDDGLAFWSLKEVARRGGVMCFHAENQALVDYYTNGLLAEQKTGVEYFPHSRPNIVEAETVRRMIYLGERAGAALYFLHLSAREAVAEVAEAKARGLPVYGESCPHYLAFNDEVYRGDRAIQFVRFPSIKSALDQEALWQGVIDGTIDCIGTDHVTALLSVKREKSKGKMFTEVPGGMPQVENRLAFMFSEGVVRRKIPVNRLVALVATNPARIFGLYPRKGALLPGSDADIVLLDPNLSKKIGPSDLHMGVDYTIYDGWTFTGLPVATIIKGKVAVRNGKFLGTPNGGKFLPGSIAPEIVARRRRS